ncbi:hypothetical protein K435DRAFT_274914 [Dendrothele bispora CBS 962.96]|uniref:Uncharacterized protein n=1 Tax=Dendrothele bispora (strain CBS 962.96) TaxID=1314807 RepID=A0A4S8LM62_DENBC|nr:hypothetical protein K435DRAFT_274914 [Dendrothele bispora CBS 962.96]
METGSVSTTLSTGASTEVEMEGRREGMEITVAGAEVDPRQDDTRVNIVQFPSTPILPSGSSQTSPDLALDYQLTTYPTPSPSNPTFTYEPYNSNSNPPQLQQFSSHSLRSPRLSSSSSSHSPPSSRFSSTNSTYPAYPPPPHTQANSTTIARYSHHFNPQTSVAAAVANFRPSSRDVISGIAPHVFDERRRRRQRRDSSSTRRSSNHYHYYGRDSSPGPGSRSRSRSRSQSHRSSSLESSSRPTSVARYAVTCESSPLRVSAVIAVEDLDLFLDSTNTDTINKGNQDVVGTHGNENHHQELQRRSSATTRTQKSSSSSSSSSSSMQRPRTATGTERQSIEASHKRTFRFGSIRRNATTKVRGQKSQRRGSSSSDTHSVHSVNSVSSSSQSTRRRRNSLNVKMDSWKMGLKSLMMLDMHLLKWVLPFRFVSYLRLPLVFLYVRFLLLSFSSRSFTYICGYDRHLFT